MPLPLPHGITVEVLHPGTPSRDSAGNYIPGPDRVEPIEGCAAWPSAGAESVETQDQVVERATLLVPYGTPVAAISKVRLWGRVFNVDGPPQSWSSPLTGTQAGIQLQLQRVTG